MIINGAGRRFCEECGQECRVSRADTWRRAGKTCPACGSRRLSVDYVPGKRNSKAPKAKPEAKPEAKSEAKPEAKPMTDQEFTDRVDMMIAPIMETA